MANPNKPFGFQALETEGKENRVRYYQKTASAVIYPGDVLKLVAGGTVEVASAGDRMIGVAAAYSASASTDAVPVIDDPEAVFVAQCSADYAAVDVGQNANIVATTGDTALKLSKNTIDSSTFNTTDTLQFKLLGLYARGANAVGSYAIVKCKPNLHAFKNGVTGI